ncbi:MAG: hypothetical protein JWM36_849 [Hyphomicrobiales bacterium]|nr:hypothetical protein [Hyphomicrobiales bacterium]
MKCLLLTTTNHAAGRRDDLQRLFDSVTHERQCGLDVELHLLIQNCSGTEAAALPYLPPFVRVQTMDGTCSLSAARNVLLSTINCRASLNDDTFVAFPDDDCWYPPHFLVHLADSFARDNDIDLFVCRFSERPVIWVPGCLALRSARFKDVVRLTSSNNMFVRGRIALRVGQFDPGLGLGTPAAGGEDTEYALHAFFQGRRALVTDACLVGHPDNSLAKVSTYYMGDLVVLARFATRSPAAFYEFARKLAVGGCLLLMKRLSMGSYVAALRASVDELKTGRTRNLAEPQVDV